jgi:hypothetical protein
MVISTALIPLAWLDIFSFGLALALPWTTISGS